MDGAGTVTDTRAAESVDRAFAGLPGLRLRLPGTWWQIPLHDIDEAKASIRTLVDQQVGRRDDRAANRAEFRQQLLAAAEAAAQANGKTMHIALEIAEGIPIPVSITVLLPEMRLTPAIGTDALSVIGILQQGLERKPGFDPQRVSRFSVRESEVLRVYHQEQTTYGEEQIPGLAVEYWITIPGFKRVALLSFSTALAGIDDIMLGFFDSIVKATYWDEPATP